MDPMTHPINGANEGIHRLRSQVAAIQAANPQNKQYPIVLVPGFSGWGRPLLGTVNYFGGFEDLPLFLSSKGYIVIVIRIGPISTNRERACEIFAQLTNPGGFVRPGLPGALINVNFDAGLPVPNPALLIGAQTPQAVLYDTPNNPLPAGWQWSAANKVSFICHSQGGTTIRYLMGLLSGAANPQLPQFLGMNRQNWVESVVTIGTPHKGTTVTDVVNDLLLSSGLGPLIDFITTCSFEARQNRVYDLHLDHWEFRRAPGESYQQMRARIAPGVITWWTSHCNGFYDNSVQGILQLNDFAPSPAPNTYYFTMSFCATRPFPNETLTAEDINGFCDLLPLNKFWNMFGVLGGVGALLLPPFIRLGVLPSCRAALAWITTVANRHLQTMGYFSQIPPPGTQIPRPDMLPLITYPAYAMAGRSIPAGTALLGITSEEFQPNDGIVNTRSMDGPTTGPVDYGSFATGRAAKAARGIYWNFGTNATIDHADQIGVFTDPTTYAEVQVMYMLFAELVNTC